MYLGDYISSSGSNSVNITKRKQKGLLIVNHIISVLGDGFFGSHFFRAACMLRESLFLNSILLNTEVCYGLTERDIGSLEVVDNRLLRGILQCFTGTPVCIMFLELFCIPIRFVIMKRRLNFLHYLLRQDEESLIYRFLMAQVRDSCRSDWVLQVKRDLEALNIVQSFEAIQTMSQKEFKNLVDEQVNHHAFTWLINKKNKLSSVINVQYKTFEMQPYLKTDDLNIAQKRLLFQMRSRTIPLRAYRKFNQSEGNTICPFCVSEPETMQHIITCSQLTKGIKWITVNKLRIEDIFSENLQSQIKILRQFEILFKRRNMLIHNFETQIQENNTAVVTSEPNNGVLQ